MTTYLAASRTVTKTIKIYHLSGTNSGQPSLESKGKAMEAGTTFFIGQPRTIVHKSESVQIVPIMEKAGRGHVMRETGQFLLLTELLKSQL